MDKTKKSIITLLLGVIGVGVTWYILSLMTTTRDPNYFLGWTMPFILISLTSFCLFSYGFTGVGFFVFNKLTQFTEKEAIK